MRDFPAVLRDEQLRQRHHVFGLHAVKADRLDQIAELRLAELDHLLRRIGELEQSRGRFFHAGIGGLRRQHHGDQQRERIDVGQFAARGGIGGGKAAERFGDLRTCPLRQFPIGGFAIAGETGLGALDPRGLAFARRSDPLPGGFTRRRIFRQVFCHRVFRIMGTMNTDNNSSGQAAVDPKIFAAIITPHRSLGPRGFLILMLCLGVLSFVSGIVFVSIGAWPVFGVFGLDVLLVYFAFRANYRTAAAYEEVVVTPSELRVRKVSHRGQVSEWALNPLWARLEYESDEDFGLQRLYLVSRGRKLAIASFLPPQEKESFAAALAAAIGEAKRGPTRTVFE